MRRWLQRVERALFRYSIPNLPTWLAAIQVVGWIVTFENPVNWINLCLTWHSVEQGEIYRLFTFLALPRTSCLHPILTLLLIHFSWFSGRAIEERWGTFWFNVMFLVAWASTLVASICTPWFPYDDYHVQTIVMLIFCWYFGDMPIRFNFIVTIPLRWLGLAAWALIARDMWVGGPARIESSLVVGVFILFCGFDVWGWMRIRWRKLEHRREVRRQQSQVLHSCAECGVTEKDNPQIDFRFCSKCQGEYEYCENHLRTHTHRTETAKNPPANQA